MWGVLEGSLGRALGVVDVLAYHVRSLTSPAHPFFRAGWGDLAAPIRASQAVVQGIGDRRPVAFAPPDISWRELEAPASGDMLSWEGSFVSPQAALLPEGVGMCRFLLLAPASVGPEWRPWAGASSGSDSATPPARDIVVLLPATGEETYEIRVSHGSRLVRERGAVVLAVTAPFYGPRQPLRAAEPTLSWRGQPLGSSPETVGELLAQSVAIIAEGTALVLWAHGRSPSSAVCVSGFSWGGAMSAGVALGAAAALPPGLAVSRLCCAPYVGSPTPEVLADGLLQSSIAWGTLIADADRCARQLTAEDPAGLGSLPRLASDAAAAAKGSSSDAKIAAAALLVAALRSLNIADIVEGHRRAAASPAWDAEPQPAKQSETTPRSCPPVLAAVLAVSASHDWYVLPRHAAMLRDSLAPISVRAGPAALESVAGGHAAAHLTRGTHQIAAIEWALEAVAADVALTPRTHDAHKGTSP